MATQLKFPSKAGGQLGGALAEPAGTANVGSIVVVQEWHGVNDHIRALCDRFAKAGYLALAPDLYHGKVATNDGDASKMMGELQWPRAVGEIGDAVAYLRAHARSNGKIGIVGFCMGGALTFAATRQLEGLACAVPFYGLPQVPASQFAGIKTPISAHFARKDDWAKASVAEQIRESVRSGGGQMDVFVYDAGHAFMREGDASKYDANASKLAWERTFEFLKKHLA
jgi:carboxymethylenebutenolidase